MPSVLSLPPAILLMGATASGKTSLALELADRFPCSLISVDSALVFKDMNIGTAKPDAKTLARYPHDLVDLITPEESYSAARFCQDAHRAMAQAVSVGKIPLLVGGTMLYFKALLHGLADLPQADAALRSALDEEAAAKGWPALHARLAELDPVTAARLKIHDAQRIQRALEVCLMTGRPMSAYLNEQKREYSLPYRVLPIGLLPSERGVLHERIATRFTEMLDKGLIEEVAALRQRYTLHPDLPSMRCVGYRQVWDWMEGSFPRHELADRGIFATRQLAKRQITWITNTLQPQCFDCLAPDLSRQVAQTMTHFLDEPDRYPSSGARTEAV